MRYRLNLFTIFFMIFWVAYTFILILGLLQLNKLEPVDGKLVAAYASYGMTQSSQKFFRPPQWDLHVEYTYQFKGISYSGLRLRIDGNSTILRVVAEKKAAEMMLNNGAIVIWVNPEDPKFSVLEPKIGLVAWLFWGFLIVVAWTVQHFFPMVA